MIRPLIVGDLPAVKRVIDATALFPSDMIDDMASPYLGSAETGEFWLVTVDDVGMVGVAYSAPERMTDGTWNLYLIAVHPDAQRRGHGAALIREVEQRVTNAGARVLLIETSSLGTFAGQRVFYRSLGYAEEARIREFYQAGEDKVVFWKAVAPSSTLAQMADSGDGRRLPKRR